MLAASRLCRGIHTSAAGVLGLATSATFDLSSIATAAALPQLGHVAAMQRLRQHYLVLLILHLNLCLIEAELLEQFQLLLLTQVLIKQQLCLLLEELHLGQLVQLLHLVQSLQLHQGLALLILTLLAEARHVEVFTGRATSALVTSAALRSDLVLHAGATRALRRRAAPLVLPVVRQQELSDLISSLADRTGLCARGEVLGGLLEDLVERDLLLLESPLNLLMELLEDLLLSTDDAVFGRE